MAPQRGQQGGIRSGRHDDFNIAGSSYVFLSQYIIVQVNQQGDHSAVPAALIQSIHKDGGSQAAGRSQSGLQQQLEGRRLVSEGLHLRGRHGQESLVGGRVVDGQLVRDTTDDLPSVNATHIGQLAKVTTIDVDRLH